MERRSVNNYPPSAHPRVTNGGSLLPHYSDAVRVPPLQAEGFGWQVPAIRAGPVTTNERAWLSQMHHSYPLGTEPLSRTCSTIAPTDYPVSAYRPIARVGFAPIRSSQAECRSGTGGHLLVLRPRLPALPANVRRACQVTAPSGLTACLHHADVLLIIRPHPPRVNEPCGTRTHIPAIGRDPALKERLIPPSNPAVRPRSGTATNGVTATPARFPRGVLGR